MARLDDSLYCTPLCSVGYGIRRQLSTCLTMPQPGCKAQRCTPGAPLTWSSFQWLARGPPAACEDGLSFSIRVASVDAAPRGNRSVPRPAAEGYVHSSGIQYSPHPLVTFRPGLASLWQELNKNDMDNKCMQTPPSPGPESASLTLAQRRGFQSTKPTSD